MFDDDVIKLKKEQFIEAESVAYLIKDELKRKLAFANTCCLFAFKNYIEKNKYKYEPVTNTNLFRVPIIAEKYGISDLYLGDIRVDVRVSLDEKTFPVPKSHIKNSLAADYYVVYKGTKNPLKCESVGYVQKENLVFESQDENYYYISVNILNPIEDFKEEINTYNKERKTFYETEHRIAKENIGAFLDDELDDVKALDMLEHLLVCTECRSLFVEYSFLEDVLTAVNYYPDLKDNLKNYIDEQEISIISDEEFVLQNTNADESKTEADETTAPIYQYEIDTPTQVTEIAAEAAGAAAAGIVAGAAASEITEAVSDSADETAIEITDDAMEIGEIEEIEEIDNIDDLDEVNETNEIVEINDLDEINEIEEIENIDNIDEINNISEIGEINTINGVSDDEKNNDIEETELSLSTDTKEINLNTEEMTDISDEIPEITDDIYSITEDTSNEEIPTEGISITEEPQNQENKSSLSDLLIEEKEEQTLSEEEQPQNEPIQKPFTGGLEYVEDKPAEEDSEEISTDIVPNITVPTQEITPIKDEYDITENTNIDEEFSIDTDDMEIKNIVLDDLNDESINFETNFEDINFNDEIKNNQEENQPTDNIAENQTAEINKEENTFKDNINDIPISDNNNGNEAKEQEETISFEDLFSDNVEIESNALDTIKDDEELNNILNNSEEIPNSENQNISTEWNDIFTDSTTKSTNTFNEQASADMPENEINQNNTGTEEINELYDTANNTFENNVNIEQQLENDAVKEKKPASAAIIIGLVVISLAIVGAGGFWFVNSTITNKAKNNTENTNNSYSENSEIETNDMDKIMTNAFSENEGNSTPIEVTKMSWDKNKSANMTPELKEYLNASASSVWDKLDETLRSVQGYIVNAPSKILISVNKNGDVTNVKIIQSCGAKEVDSVILSSVKNVLATMPPSTYSVKGENLNLTLVVNF